MLLRKHWLECHSDDSNSRPTHSQQQVSSATGVVTRWAVAGTEILAEPIVPCFYRAPTDNDRGGSGGNSHANRCGFGSKKMGSNFRGPGSSVLRRGPLPVDDDGGVLLEQTKNPPPPLTLTNLKHLQIAFYPPQSNRWKEAGLDRMAVVPETVELASKAASEGCVEVRFRAKKCGLFPLFFADLSPLFPRSALIFSSFD